MKQMATRLLAMLLVLGCLLSVVGCGNQPDGSTPEDSSSTSDTDFDWGFDDTTTTTTDAGATDTSGSDSTTTTTEGSVVDGTTGKTSKSTNGKTTTTTAPKDSVQGATDSSKFNWPKMEFGGKKTVKVLTFGDIGETHNKLLKETYGLTATAVVVGWFDIDAKLAAMVLADDAPDAVNYKPDSTSLYAFPYSDLVQPIESYVDFSNPIYKDQLYNYAATKVNGKNYVLINKVSSGAFLLYNKRIFRESGVKEPWDYYKEGNWTWDTMAEIAPKLCADTNGDGTMDQLALATGDPNIFVLTTGQNYGYLDLEKEKAVSNMKNKSIARAVNYLIQSGFKDKWSSNSVEDASTLFRDEMVAMMIRGDTNFTGNEGTIAQNGELGIAPIPKDPKADKYYAHRYVTGFFIPQKAKNPQGGVAYAATSYYLNMSAEGVALNKKAYEPLGFTEEHWSRIEELTNTVTPVYNLASVYLGYNAVWTSSLVGAPWSTNLAYYQKQFDADVEALFATKK